MWRASGGGVGSVVELAKGACQEARSDRVAVVAIAHFSRAYRVMGNTGVGAVDPFALDSEQVLQLAAKQHRLSKPPSHGRHP